MAPTNRHSFQPSVDSKNNFASAGKIKLLQHFPQEIWMLILGKLELTNDAETYEKISNSHQFFRDLLLPKRTLFLFAKAWKVFVENYTMPNLSDCTDYLKEEQVRRSQLLNLRSTCRLWCSVIDSFYRNHSQHYEMGWEDPSKLETYIETKSSQFRNKGHVNMLSQTARFRLNVCYRKFLNHFDLTHKNRNRSPFVLNTVVIMIPGMYQFERCSALILNLLRLYGQYIWHADIRVQTSAFTQGRFSYATLCQYLTLMPNLKTLLLVYDRLDGHKKFRVNENEAMLTPTLTKLECLTVSNFPLAITHKIFEKNNHVSSLYYLRQVPTFSFCFDSLRLPVLHSVKKLGINICYQQELDNLANSQINGVIESLYLNFGSVRFIKWSHVFQVIHDKFATSVKSLVIFLPVAQYLNEEQEIAKECSTLRLNFPKLTRLKVYMRSCSSLDFLLGLSSTLEYLCMEIPFPKTIEESSLLEYFKEIESKETIKFWSCNRDMERSNIWKLLPKLREINFKSLCTVVNGWSRPTQVERV